MKDFTNTWKNLILIEDDSFFEDKDDSFCMPLFEDSDDVVITKKDLIEMREQHIKEVQEINKRVALICAPIVGQQGGAYFYGKKKQTKRKV